MEDELIQQGWTLLLNASLRSLFLLAVSGLALLCLRRSSAAVRHLVLLLTLACLLCLPLISATLPGWHVAFLPQATVVSALRLHTPDVISSTPDIGMTAAPVPSAGPSAMVAAPTPGFANAPAPVVRARTTPNWPLIGLVLWAGGVCVSLSPLLAGLVGLRRLRRQSESIEGSIFDIASDLGQKFGLHHPAPLRQSVSEEMPVVPMTWGWRRPVILLPLGAGDWSEERLRVVLLHELAHIQRRDWLWQMLAHGVCALYWFHPGVWLVARQLRLESERACDDQVLSTGVPAQEYAHHLVEIARSLSPTKALSRMAMPMAEPSHVECRLRSILAPGQDRQRLRPGIWGIALTLTFVLLVTLGRFTSTVQAAQEKPEMTPIGIAPKAVTTDVRHGLKGPVKSVYVEAASLRPANGHWQEGTREFFEEQSYDKRQQLTKWVFRTSKPGGRRVTLYDADGRTARTTEYLPDGSLYTTNEMTYDSQGRETGGMGRHRDGTPGAYYKTTCNPVTREETTTSYDANRNVTQCDVDKKDKQGNLVASKTLDANGREISRSVIFYGLDGKITDQYNYLNGTLISHEADHYDTKRATRTVFDYEAKLGPAVWKGNLPPRLHAVSPIRLTRKEEVVPGTADEFDNHPRSVTYEWVLRNGRLVPTTAIVWYRTMQYYK